MRILGSSIERQLGSSMNWGRQWVVDGSSMMMISSRTRSAFEHL